MRADSKSLTRPASWYESERDQGGCLAVLRLDYLSCVLTVFSTVLVGRKCWEGWALAAINSVILCFIGFRTEQLGFIPANLFCIVLYGVNVHRWRRSQLS